MRIIVICSSEFCMIFMGILNSFRPFKVGAFIRNLNIMKTRNGTPPPGPSDDMCARDLTPVGVTGVGRRSDML